MEYCQNDVKPQIIDQSIESDLKMANQGIVLWALVAGFDFSYLIQPSINCTLAV